MLTNPEASEGAIPINMEEEQKPDSQQPDGSAGSTVKPPGTVLGTLLIVFIKGFQLCLIAFLVFRFLDFEST